MKKSLIRFCISLLAAVFLVTAVGAAEFHADMVIRSAAGGEMHGRVFVKGNSLRQELETPVGTQVSIVKDGGRVMYVLIPGQKMYMEFPNNQVSLSEGESIESKYGDEAKLEKTGTENLQGYECDIYSVEYEDPGFGKSTVWIARKLNYPLKIHSESAQDTATITYSNVKEQKVPDSFFELPGGYARFSM